MKRFRLQGLAGKYPELRHDEESAAAVIGRRDELPMEGGFVRSE
jgi:hypothetical protein